MPAKRSDCPTDAQDRPPGGIEANEVGLTALRVLLEARREGRFESREAGRTRTARMLDRKRTAQALPS